MSGFGLFPALQGDGWEGQLFANSVEKLPQNPDAEFYLRFEAWSLSSI